MSGKGRVGAGRCVAYCAYSLAILQFCLLELATPGLYTSAAVLNLYHIRLVG